MDVPKFEISPFGPPSTGGVYMICVRPFSAESGMGEERIIYIGSSKNIQKRVLTPKHPYRKSLTDLAGSLVYTKFYECAEYSGLEKELIAHFNPILNKQHTKRQYNG